MDPAIYRKYKARYPLVFKIDEVTLPNLEFSKVGFDGWYFKDKNVTGQIVDVGAFEYLSPEGFLANYFVIPENILGGIGGEMGGRLLGVGKKRNVSYDTFEIAKWANSKANSHSFTKHIESNIRRANRIVKNKTKKDGADIF